MELAPLETHSANSMALFQPIAPPSIFQALFYCSGLFYLIQLLKLSCQQVKKIWTLIKNFQLKTFWWEIGKYFEKATPADPTYHKPTYSIVKSVTYFFVNTDQYLTLVFLAKFIISRLLSSSQNCFSFIHQFFFFFL